MVLRSSGCGELGRAVEALASHLGHAQWSQEAGRRRGRPAAGNIANRKTIGLQTSAEHLFKRNRGLEGETGSIEPGVAALEAQCVGIFAIECKSLESSKSQQH